MEAPAELSDVGATAHGTQTTSPVSLGALVELVAPEDRPVVVRYDCA